jgi:putative endonuclease
MASMSAARQTFGRLGEALAARWLEARGWRVLDRRYRVGHRDIDLVVERGDTVAFVEVKARHSAELGDPIEAVNWRKRNDLARSAAVWIDRRGAGERVFRFDVIGVLVVNGRVRIRHVEDAFRTPLSG